MAQALGSKVTVLSGSPAEARYALTPGPPRGKPTCRVFGKFGWSKLQLGTGQARREHILVTRATLLCLNWPWTDALPCAGMFKPVTPFECVSSSQCLWVSAVPGAAKMPSALNKSARMRHCSGHLQGTAAPISRCLQCWEHCAYTCRRDGTGRAKPDNPGVIVYTALHNAGCSPRTQVANNMQPSHHIRMNSIESWLSLLSGVVDTLACLLAV